MDEFGGLTMLIYASKGVTVYVNEQDCVVCIFLFAAGVEDNCESIFLLPRGLSFSQSSADVGRALGEPAESGINEHGRVWEKFKYPDYALHLEIRLATMMAPLDEISSP